MRFHRPAAPPPHHTVAPPPINLAQYVRDMFAGAIGDHALPFRTFEEAEQAVTVSLEYRAGRRLTQSELVKISLAVSSLWVTGQLEAEAYAEDARRAAQRLGSSRRMDLRTIISAAFEGRNLLGGPAFAPFRVAGDAEIAITAALEAYGDRPLTNSELHIVSMEVAMEWTRRQSRVRHDDETFTPAAVVEALVL